MNSETPDYRAIHLFTPFWKNTMKQALIVSVFVLAIGFASVAPAQLSSLFSSRRATEAPAKNRLAIEQADKTGQAEKGLKIEKQFTGRLPHGYKDVVTDEQREKIYKVQQEYFEAIELLKQRLDLLETERNQHIDALLNADQHAKLKSALGELESERTARRAIDRAAGKEVDEADHAEAHRHRTTAAKTAEPAAATTTTTEPGAAHSTRQRGADGRFLPKETEEKEEHVKAAKTHRTRARKHATEAKKAAAETGDAEDVKAAAEAEKSANEAAKEVEAAEEAATPAEAKKHAENAKKHADDAETHSTKTKRHRTKKAA